MESKKHQADVVARTVQTERHERQGLQLICLERGQEVRASQEDQWSEMVECVDGHNGDVQEPEERRKQRKAPAHRLEQLIEDERHGGIARERDEISGASQT